MTTYAKSFDWNCICQVCREQVKASECVRRWDGLIVARNHAECFEHRSPLDMPAPPLREQRALPFTSKDSTDVYIQTFCTVEGRLAIAGLGIAGCMLLGNIDTSQIYDPTNNLYPG